METKYRAALIGCGRISGAHVAAFRDSGRFELVAVVDIRAEVARDLATKHGIPHWYTDYESMLSEVAPDVVTVATWAGLHAEMTIRSAEAGVIGILCEKPMAPSLGGARGMLDACLANGVKLAVGHQHRFDPPWVRARELIAAGAIGAPLLASVRVTDGLTNNGTHYIDGVRFIFGDPANEWAIAQVERQTDRHERGEPIEDRLAALVSFANGARLAVEVDLPDVEGAAAQPPLVVHGTDGTIQAGWSDLRLFDRDGLTEMQFTNDVPSHQRQAVEFARWLDGEIDDYRGSGDRAYETVAVMMGMYESVRAGGAVRFPLEPGESPLELMIASGRLPISVPGRYDIRA